MIKKIRVLIVDDSIFFRKVLIDNLSKFNNIEIIGYAVDAFDAKNKINELKPEVVTMDVEMPRMNGIEFLKQLLPQNMLPVVLVSSLNISVFDALSAGAVDFMRKPNLQSKEDLAAFFSELSRKITIASTANLKAKIRKPMQVSSIDAILKDTPLLNSVYIAIGASTGGTEATLAVLKSLPAHTPGILVVQHMPPGFTKMYAQRLNGICPMEVKEAESGDKVQRGRVLIAPGDLQMKVVKIGREFSVNCYKGERVNGHCPSVDVLFQSVADTMGQNAIGVIMTGMGSDGARGLLSMRKKGSFTIGQDEESCIVYGMPKVAKDMGGVTVEVPCSKISDVLKRQLNKAFTNT